MLSEQNSSLENRRSTQPRWLPWAVCFSASMFFFYEFIQLNMFNAISNDLMTTFNIDAASLGSLSSTYLIADVIFLFPAGILLDRLSTRKIILTAVSLCITGTIGFALSVNYYMAASFHFMAGIGAAFCFLSCLMLASRWFPPRQLAFITGLIVTIAMAGGAVAQTPLTLLIDSFGWRQALLMDGGLGVAIFILIFTFVQDAPKDPKDNYGASPNMELPFLESIKHALSNPQNWLCGLYTSLLNLPIMLLGALWGSLYLTQVYGFSQTQASDASGMIFLGTIIGSPIMGWISDKMQRRRLPMVAGAILSISTILIIMYVPNLSLGNIIGLFFILGFFTASQIISYPAIAESCPKKFRGCSLGLGSVLIMGGGALFQPVFGWLMDYNWDGKIVNGVRIYSPENFHLALLILPTAFVIALLISFMMKETNCQTYVE